MAKKSLNIYTIAKEAGVSPSTVSRVITKNARVSDEKRKRVEEIIQKYDYRPSALAQGLTNTQTKAIGILASDLKNPYYGQLLTSCEQQIHKLGYYPVLFSTTSSYELEVEYLQKMFDLRIDAIILIGGISDHLVTDPEYADLINRLTENIPIITTGKIDGTKCYQVSIDEMHGLELAMDHLFSLGHRHIAMIGGRSFVKSTYDKRMRYRALLRNHGITFRDWYLPESGYDIEGGYTCMNQLFEAEGPFPTAIMAINDFCAVGAKQSIQEHGLSIPDDIAMISFDGTFIVDAVYPKLTNIRYDYEDFGEKLANTAIRLINGQEVPLIQKISSHLIVQDSTLPK